MINECLSLTAHKRTCDSFISWVMGLKAHVKIPCYVDWLWSRDLFYNVLKLVPEGLSDSF